MKNFRKVLALVLVMATLFSFTAMAGAVNVGEYDDWSDVSYAEAVDVLSAVGILNGYEDDTFKPENTISREEMAKMIAVLANSGSDVSKLYASAASFADVPAERWSASYVAYCAKTGIVAGRSASTFDPTGKVTGLETAKMLLVVLGFDADVQGYVGADWKVNVLRDAKVMGLLNGFAAGYNVDAAITREEAAQMMLNALEAPAVVGVLSDGLVEVTNALIVNWPGAGNVTVSNLLNISAYATLKDALAAGKWCLYENVVISNDILYKVLFNGQLVKHANGDRDCFGRPATYWTWTDSLKNDYVLAMDVAEPVWSSTKTNATEIADVVADYEKVADLDYQFVDGKAGTVDGGKGVLVELYVVGDEMTLVEIHTHIGTIEQMNTAKKTFKLDNYTVANVYGYTTDDEGTTVMYWVCEDGVHTVAELNTKAITVHGTRVVADYFCDAAGNKYEYSADFTGTKLGVNELGADVVLILDNYGYVLAWTYAPTAGAEIAVLVSDSALATNPTASANDAWDWDYTAEFVDFENNAAPAEYTVDRQTYDVDKDASSDVLVAYYASKDARVKAVAATTATGTDYVLNEGSGIITGLDVAGNSDTQYILRVYNWMTGKYEYKYFDGKEEIDATYALTNLQYFTTAYNYNAAVTGKYEYLAYVYAEATYAVESTMAFILGYYTDESYITEGGSKLTYHLHKAIVNGEEAYVAYQMKLDNTNIMYLGSYVMINAESHDGLPIYVATGKITTSAGKNYVVEGNTVYFTDAEGKTAVADLAKDAQIVIVTKVNGKIAIDNDATADDVVEIAEFHGWSNTYSWFAKSGNTITTLFVYVEG